MVSGMVTAIVMVQAERHQIQETAEALGISTPTAKRDWLYARAWLFRELHRGD